MEQRGWATRVGIGLVNWRTGGTNAFRQKLGGTSRITREGYVRFCEGLGVQFPGPTRHLNFWPNLADASRHFSRATESAH